MIDNADANFEASQRYSLDDLQPALWALQYTTSKNLSVSRKGCMQIRRLLILFRAGLSAHVNIPNPCKVAGDGLIKMANATRSIGSQVFRPKHYVSCSHLCFPIAIFLKSPFLPHTPFLPARELLFDIRFVQHKMSRFLFSRLFYTKLSGLPIERGASMTTGGFAIPTRIYQRARPRT